MRCPTCGARHQEHVDQCRRCKCDLTLLRRLLEEQERLLCVFHESLKENQPEEALRAARELHRIEPNEESARRLALAYLHAGDFPTATRWARAA